MYLERQRNTIISKCSAVHSSKSWQNVLLSENLLRREVLQLSIAKMSTKSTAVPGTTCRT